MDETICVHENEMMDLSNNLENTYQTVFNKFDCILSKFSNLRVHLTGMQNEIRSLEKRVRKEFKDIKKRVDAKKKLKGLKKPSGFAAPSKVSNELCEFLNKDAGTNVARTDVTKAVIDYIETNKLTLKENKKTIIVPDEKLKALLGVDQSNDEAPLTFFTLQKFMNKHFIKEPSIDA